MTDTRQQSPGAHPVCPVGIQARFGSGAPWPGSEAGVALITALLVVAIVTSTAVAMASRHYLSIRQTANLLGRDQARLIALGGEFWARQVLEKDRKESKIDTLDEVWASQPAAVAVQGGRLHGRIHDRQALFNLNTLIDGNGKQNPVAMARFQRLLDQHHLPASLAMAVADWMDPDTVVAGFGGAEDETYLTRDPPFFAANRSMLSVSELAIIEGFDAKSVETLRPWVATLPEATAINVNTAPVEILQILAPGLSHQDAQGLANARERGGFASVADFLQQAVFEENKPPGEGLSVSSAYFQATLLAQVGQGQVRLFSLLGRQGNRVTMLRRRYGVE